MHLLTLSFFNNIVMDWQTDYLTEAIMVKKGTNRPDSSVWYRLKILTAYHGLAAQLIIGNRYSLSLSYYQCKQK